MQYTHQELGQDVQSISGTYTPIREMSLPHNGGNILCVIGMAVVDTACCGSGSFLYATVPGYVISTEANGGEGRASVSEIEPITDGAVRREVSRVLRETEGIHNVNFW
jgi:hypothetical protein